MVNLKARRKEAGYTQAEVAAYIGLSQPQYSAWENGKSRIDHISLEKLAALFGCTVDALITKSETTSVRIPVLGEVAAGIPIEAVTDIVDYEEIDAAMAATGEFFGLRIKGASMEGSTLSAKAMWAASRLVPLTRKAPAVILPRASMSGYMASVGRALTRPTNIAVKLWGFMRSRWPSRVNGRDKRRRTSSATGRLPSRTPSPSLRWAPV